MKNHPLATRDTGDLILDQWRVLEHLRKAVLKRQAPGDIHDLRVASRRLRVTLTLLAPFLSLGRKPGRRIRRLTRSLGRLRNIDEAQAYFSCKRGEFSELFAALARARKDELKTVLDALRAFPAAKIDKTLQDAYAALPAGQQRGMPSSLRAHLSALAAKRFRAISLLIPPAMAPEEKEARHRLRIAIKKWRYLLESMERICGNDHRESLELLKEYQTVLGRLNDLEEFGRLCRKLGIPAAVRHEAKTMLARDAEEYLAQFMALVGRRHPQPVTTEVVEKRASRRRPRKPSCAA